MGMSQKRKLPASMKRCSNVVNKEVKSKQSSNIMFTYPTGKKSKYKGPIPVRVRDTDERVLPFIAARNESCCSHLRKLRGSY